jgi:nucleoside-diphosphate-sugar epimerase
MKAFVTGATGFLGGRLVDRLRQRSDTVICLVRSPEKANGLDGQGCTLVQGDLQAREAMEEAMRGCDAVFHLAADYRVGVRDDVRESMERTNVEGTRNVLDAAAAAGVPRIVYVSTVAVFGNTHGEVIDESFEHPGRSFTSKYEETKWRAHLVAKEKAAAGAPIVIVQPGAIYGPGDKSAMGEQLSQAATGKLPAVAFPKLGLNMVHVDDVVEGLLLACEKGEQGQSYVLGGEITTLRGALETAAAAAGRKPPRFNVPTGFLKALTPFGPLVGKAMGAPPNLRELITTSDGVTFWATDDRARRELGYSPRDMRTGLAEVYGTK